MQGNPSSMEPEPSVDPGWPVAFVRNAAQPTGLSSAVPRSCKQSPHGRWDLQVVKTKLLLLQHRSCLGLLFCGRHKKRIAHIFLFFFSSLKN